MGRVGIKESLSSSFQFIESSQGSDYVGIEGEIGLKSYRIVHPNLTVFESEQVQVGNKNRTENRKVQDSSRQSMI